MKAFPAREMQPRKVLILQDIDDLGGLPVRQNPARQPNTRRQDRSATHRLEVLHLHHWRMPRQSAPSIQSSPSR